MNYPSMSIQTDVWITTSFLREGTQCVWQENLITLPTKYSENCGWFFSTQFFGGRKREQDRYTRASERLFCEQVS